MLIEISLAGCSIPTDVAGQQRLRMRKQMLLQLVLSVKSFVAQITVEWSFVDRAVLDQVGTCGKLLVTHCACVRPVAKVQVLMFHQDVFVAKAPLTDVALIRLLPNVRQSQLQMRNEQ